jgi:pectate lyase
MLEHARAQSQRNQQAHTEINVGSNTTQLGLRGATLRHATLMFDRADNVIVRNLTFEDAVDCFPQMAAHLRPDRQPELVLRQRIGPPRVEFWTDHNTFRTSREDLPEYFDRKYEVYDGAAGHHAHSQPGVAQRLR